MSMISIHDNEILAYTVDLANKTIRLDTTWSSKERSEHTLVEFRGVLTHYFIGDCHQNVLTSIEEEPLEIFLSENLALLQEMKYTCWPCMYAHSYDECGNENLLRQRLQEEQVKYFRLYAAIGVDGWVLAREMEFIALGDSPQAGYDHFDIY